MSKLEVDEIVAKRITVRSGEYEIVIQGGDTVGGIWIQKVGQPAPCVCIYMQGDSPVIGVHSKENVNIACAAALSIDDKGSGVLQIVKDGKVCNPLE